MNAEVLTQLRRKNNLLKWGEQNWPNGTGPTVVRNAARAAAQARVDAGLKTGAVTYFDILQEEFHEAACEATDERLVAELIDVAAVAQDFADAILRRAAKKDQASKPGRK